MDHRWVPDSLQDSADEADEALKAYKKEAVYSDELLKGIVEEGDFPFRLGESAVILRIQQQHLQRASDKLGALADAIKSFSDQIGEDELVEEVEGFQPYLQEGTLFLSTVSIVDAAVECGEAQRTRLDLESSIREPRAEYDWLEFDDEFWASIPSTNCKLEFRMLVPLGPEETEDLRKGWESTLESEWEAYWESYLKDQEESGELTEDEFYDLKTHYEADHRHEWFTNIEDSEAYSVMEQQYYQEEVIDDWEAGASTTAFKLEGTQAVVESWLQAFKDLLTERFIHQRGIEEVEIPRRVSLNDVAAVWILKDTGQIEFREIEGTYGTSYASSTQLYDAWTRAGKELDEDGQPIRSKVPIFLEVEVVMDIKF